MKQFIHQQVSPASQMLETIHKQTSSSIMHASNGSKGLIRTFIVSTALVLLTSPVMAQILGTPSVCAGSTVSLSCINLGGTWSSSNTGVATVNATTGVVTGVSVGSTTISYTLLGIPLTTPFTVNPLPNAGSISGSTTVCLGYSTTALGVTGAAGGTGTWSTSNAIASVGLTSGVVTGNAIGADSIKYTVTNGCGTSVAAMNMSVLGQLGYIYTYGGTGVGGFSGDNGPAYLAQMGNPRDIYFDPIANLLYFCDPQNNRVRRVTTSGIITTVAGSSGTAGNAGDGGQATTATLNAANGIYADATGNLFISNTAAKTVRKVNTSGIISTIAGTGAGGSTGDGGQATAATFNFPLGIYEDSSGNVYVADQGNNNVRLINATTGVITTVAGSSAGTSGYSGDGGPASACLMFGVRGIAVDYWGNMYFADAFNNRVRKYVPSTGIITCIAGNGIAGHTGDGGPATAAEMYNPSRFAYDGADILYVSDQASQVIRSINLATGIINTVAGNAATGFSGDYGAATAAEINTPAGIAVDHVGNFYIADAVNNRVRIVSTNGSVRLLGPMNVDAGTPVTYTADLSAPGTATYQFIKNGTYVTGSGATYTNTAPANGDEYQVIATVTPPCGSSYTLTSNVINLTVNPTITASAGPYGTISPSGFLSLPSGSQTYTITPNSSCHITSVVVDGSSQGGDDGETSYTFANPTPIAHTIVASFAPNCTAPTIANPATATNVTCYGGSDGAVTTSVTCSSPVTYSWSNGDTTANLTNVPAGTYTYTATAPCGSVSGYIIVSQPSALVATATITQASCHGGAASVDVSAAGGTGAYTSTGSFSLADGTSSTYTIQDANSCSATSNSVTAASPSVIVASASITQASCHGSAASVNVSATGGSGSYIGTGTFSQADGTSATYTVNDASSCSATSNSVSATSPSAVVATATITQASCHGNAASVNVSATGGAGNYTGTGTFSLADATSATYTVNDGSSCSATSNSVTATSPSAVAATATITQASCHGSAASVNVTATGGTGAHTGTGTFSLADATSSTYTVHDANSCTATSNSVTATSPSAVAATATITQASCHGSAASVNVTATGGTGAYTGTGTFSLTDATSSTYTVHDANSCTATSNSVTATSPSAVSASASAGTISCNGGTTTVTVAGSGGTGTLTGTGTFTSVSAGTHSYTVTDTHGCTASSSTTISQPAVLSASASVTNVSGSSSNNGSVTVSATGGTTPYSTGVGTYTGLTAGTYNYTVTDANSCAASVSAAVTQPVVATCTITGNSTVLGGVTYTYTAPSGMDSYSWSISGGDHICDASCHHNSAHVCGPGCDHYGHSCTSACHHNSGHVCTNQHYGDHHCNIYCHHNSGHVCGPGCDHYGKACTSACHHNADHHCSHDHCGGASISGSSTGSSVSILNPCCVSTYTITLTTTKGSSSCTSTLAVNVTASSTTTIYSAQYSTGCGRYPSTTKTALPCNIKVFDRTTCGARDYSQSHYSSTWGSTTGLISNCVISSPVSVNIGGGPAYKYTVTVPASGHYLVLGQCNISSSAYSGGSCNIYTGSKVGGHLSCDGYDYTDEDDDGGCSNTITRYPCVLKDNYGRCSEGCSQQQYGSLMLIVSPAALTFTDSTSLLPVVYESMEGSWDVSVSANPPYGFYTDADSLSTSVTDSTMNAVQFTVNDTGSEWTNTQLTHNIFHKGAPRVAYSSPKMINERTNKPTTLTISPNPASDQISIVLNKFEGKATIHVYDLLGQELASKPMNSISGESVSMDVSSLTPGTYMVTAENTYGKATGRLVINRNK